MKIKKYRATSMPEAMKKIRHELGNDAVILNSKEIETGGFLGLFTKKNIEVIAAIDAVRESKPLAPPSPSKSRPKTSSPYRAEKNHEQSFANDHLSVSPAEDTDILNEIKTLRKMVENVNVRHEGSKDTEYPAPLKAVSLLLANQEVSPDLQAIIMKKMLKNWYMAEETGVTTHLIKQWLREILLELLSKVDMDDGLLDRPIIHIVGPTGVGKTTTIAKLAAQSVLNKNKKVAMITTDTYRIASVEQLRTYAKILNVPVEVAYSIDDFKRAKQKFSDYDLTLVDSAGRNFHNELYVEELKQVIDFADEANTYLVLALTSKYNDMRAIYEQFSAKISIDRVIFTKRDETVNHGAMLNIATDYNVGVAYITNGQNVPDDIIEATKEDIINPFLEVHE